jgi:hypothetical protein
MSLRGHEWLKELTGYLGRNSWACVGNADHQHAVFRRGAGYEQLASTRILHGFDSIAYQVQEYLLNLNFVSERKIV